MATFRQCINIKRSYIFFILKNIFFFACIPIYCYFYHIGTFFLSIIVIPHFPVSTEPIAILIKIM